MKWDESDTEQPELFEPGGVYDATVVEANEKESKKGNLYINLKLKVYATPDKSFTMYTMVMPQFPSKFKAFCLSAGLQAQYAAQELSPGDCYQRNCRVILSDAKNERGYYDVESFQVTAEAEMKLQHAKDQLAAGASSAPSDDDIPF